MEITIVLAKILGISFTIIGVALLFNRKGVSLAVEGLVQNQGLLWLSGIFTLMLGALLVTVNNVWNDGLMSLLVTIIGWIALVKGAFIVIFPRSASKFYEKFVKGGMITFSGIIALILGLVLLYK